MILWQIFDFFAKVNIYDDPPFYISFLNMSVNWPGLIWFCFIAGTGMYLSVRRREENGKNQLEIAKHILKRYGGLILLSLVFTIYMGSICTFSGWGEALEGIGLGVLAAFVIVYFIKSDVILSIFIILLSIAQQIVRWYILSPEKGFPGCFITKAPAFELLDNILFKGLFALTHIVPMILAGVVLGKIIERYKDRTRERIVLRYALVFTILGIVLGLAGLGINYYGRSGPAIILMIGISYLLFFLIEKLYNYKELLKPIETFGKAAIVAYLLHFAVIYKGAQLLGVADTMGILPSAVLSIILTSLLYFVCDYYVKSNEHKGKK